MKSIMHDRNFGTCYLCMVLHDDYQRRAVLEEHHVIYGTSNRKLSEKYGLKVYLCPQHHRSSSESIHDNKSQNKDIDIRLKQQAQMAFEEFYPKLNFMEIFGMNYL